MNYEFHVCILKNIHIKNKKQNLKYNKMTCEKMEDQIEIIFIFKFEI
jgi:hypothetical protein